MDIAKRYQHLIDLVKMRKREMGEFVSFLETKTSWLTSPASTRFHNCFEKGLLGYSISVAETLLKMKHILAPDIDDERCVIVGLFHDVGKVGLPGKPFYIRNPDVKQRYRRYIVNPEIVSMGLAVRSLLLVSQFIPLSEEEAQAIVYHDGQYIEENRIVAHREEPLTLLLSYADNWAGSILEKKDEDSQT